MESKVGFWKTIVALFALAIVNAAIPITEGNNEKKKTIIPVENILFLAVDSSLAV